MKKLSFLILLVLLALCLLLPSCLSTSYPVEKIPPPSPEIQQQIQQLYKDCQLEKLLDYSIFYTAMIGFYAIRPCKKKIISIVDFSKPSTEKRFYVIDLKKKKVLFHTWVAHGKHTGKNYARRFSNIEGSKQSSLGFYLTSNPYKGKHGYSLRLNGREKGINHLARQRAIVIHAADYVSPEFIAEHGRLGRSWGCPALPKEVSTAIIKTIKRGSCLFIYANNRQYFRQSMYIPDSK